MTVDQMIWAMSNLLKTGIFSVIPIEHVQSISFLPVFLEVTVAQNQSFHAGKQCAVSCCAQKYAFQRMDLN